MLRSLLRRGAEGVLGGRIADARVGRRRVSDTLVLAFHNVVPDGAPAAGDRSLHLALSTFRELMERLARICTPISLSALADGTAPTGRPRFAVTFDDAYRGALTLALPELVRLHIPATIFVPTACIGDHDFWWDALAHPKHGLDDAFRHHALETLAGDDAAIRAWAESRGQAARAMPPLWRSVTHDELRAAADLRGITLAPHTARHRALDRLAPDERREELEAPLAGFASHALPPVRTLAYPYGRSSPAVIADTQGAGYDSAWLVSGGWMGGAFGDSRFALPRLNVGARASVRGLFLRAASLLPL